MDDQHDAWPDEVDDPDGDLDESGAPEARPWWPWAAGVVLGIALVAVAVPFLRGDGDDPTTPLADRTAAPATTAATASPATPTEIATTAEPTEPGRTAS